MSNHDQGQNDMNRSNVTPLRASTLRFGRLDLLSRLPRLSSLEPQFPNLSAQAKSVVAIGPVWTRCPFARADCVRSPRYLAYPDSHPLSIIPIVISLSVDW